MSTVVLGANTKLALGLAANARVQFAGSAQGTTNITKGRTIPTRRIPGARGGGASMAGKFVDHSFGPVTTDFNATHRDVLVSAPGNRLYGAYDEAGTPAEVTFECVVSNWTMTLNVADDSITVALTLPVDGTPT